MSFQQQLEAADISDQKRRVLELNHEYLMPNRVETFFGLGLSMVIGKREGYRIWDIDGKELQDFHINGGTYNLGHRNPELLAVLRDALETLDVGNHHFPSEARGLLAEKLAGLTPGDLHYSVFTPSGSEANDVAIKSARHATGRRKIVSIDAGFHGSSGLSGAAGDDTNAAYFNSNFPDDFIKVPFNDLSAIEAALGGDDVAAVLIEPIPATFGFPMPTDDYLPGIRALTKKHGTMMIADEVQTGLGRTGALWACDVWNVEPDMLITGKGIAGGLYPLGAVVMTREVGQWLSERGWGYVSTFGGSELACRVAARGLDIASSQQTKSNVAEISAYLGAGLSDIQSRYAFLKDIRQQGVIFGLGFDDPIGGVKMSAALYEAGLWAMFAGFDRSYLQFKAGLLVDKPYCDEALEKLETALKKVSG